MDLNKIVRTASVFSAALAFCFLGAVGVAQADSIYMTVAGETQGNISTGASPGAGDHENEITVFGFGHSVTIPTDPATGQPTGQRIHRPLRIFKTFDRTSPLLYEALTRGEMMTEVVIKFWRTTVTGTTEHYYTITLTDAIITDITAAAGAEGAESREVVSFHYRMIEWVNEIFGTSGADDWRAPQE